MNPLPAVQVLVGRRLRVHGEPEDDVNGRPKVFFFSVDGAFAYFTECALATVETLPKRTPTGRRGRLTNIASDMVDVCKQYKLGAHSGLPRLSKRLGVAP